VGLGQSAADHAEAFTLTLEDDPMTVEELITLLIAFPNPHATVYLQSGDQPYVEPTYIIATPDGEGCDIQSTPAPLPCPLTLEA
jgi:hypothetical protein